MNEKSEKQKLAEALGAKIIPSEDFQEHPTEAGSFIDIILAILEALGPSLESRAKRRNQDPVEYTRRLTTRGFGNRFRRHALANIVREYVGRDADPLLVAELRDQLWDAGREPNLSKMLFDA